jgi:hypothetical protein
LEVLTDDGFEFHFFPGVSFPEQLAVGIEDNNCGVTFHCERITHSTGRRSRFHVDGVVQLPDLGITLGSLKTLE